MPPNTRTSLIKRSHKTRQNRYFGEEVPDCKDGSGLQLILGQICPEIEARPFCLSIFLCFYHFHHFSLPIARQ